MSERKAATWMAAILFALTVAAVALYAMSSSGLGSGGDRTQALRALSEKLRNADQ